MMAAWKIAPALAAGNTVVLKPSEQTPLTTLKLAEILAELFPAGRRQRRPRPRRSGGRAARHPSRRPHGLAHRQPRDRHRRCWRQPPPTIKRTHLELGGKAPVIVFDDADLDAVVAGLRMFGFYNAGQDCTAACRVYAGAKIYDKLVADLASRGRRSSSARRTARTARSGR